LVVEAHGVVSDPQRRERYDLGEDEDGMNGAGSGDGFGGAGFTVNPGDMIDIFAQFASARFGGGGGGGHRGHTHGFPF
jgi:DnaJ homolog subfamily C member 7